jgi:hypothetical protein
MVRTLEQAIAQISRLPDADQENIGRRLLSHVEKLNSLRGNFSHHERRVRRHALERRRTVLLNQAHATSAGF